MRMRGNAYVNQWRALSRSRQRAHQASAASASGAGGISLVAA